MASPISSRLHNGVTISGTNWHITPEDILLILVLAILEPVSLHCLFSITLS